MRNFFDTSMKEICRSKMFHPIRHVLFFGFICCLYHNLWLAMSHYLKAKIENGTGHSQKLMLLIIGTRHG